MSSDDDDDVTAQAFAGLKGHVDGYKHYMSKLKKGARSGISQSFGNAADLLPPEHLTQYKRVDKPLEVGSSVLKDNADPNVLREAVEQMVLMANADGQDQPSSDGREIIAVLFEDGKKMFMYDDYSVEPAPEPVVQNTEIAEPDDPAVAASELPVPVSPVAPVVPVASPITSSFSYAGPVANLPPEPSPVPMAKVASATNTPAPAAAAEPEIEAPKQGAADLHVTTANGSWLWDITMDGDEVALIVTADGTAIQKADGNRFVITKALQPGQKVPQVEIVADVTANPGTGNIYYQTIAGTQAIALLNNGWRIDQVKRAEGDDEYFVTEPARAGHNSPVRQQVVSLTIDPDSGEIKYDTIDGGATMTLKCRRLG